MESMPIRITAFNRSDLERKLDEAVAVAKDAALRERSRGILVTRHHSDTFTVELSSAVPFGTTRESSLSDAPDRFS